MCQVLSGRSTCMIIRSHEPQYDISLSWYPQLGTDLQFIKSFWIFLRSVNSDQLVNLLHWGMIKISIREKMKGNSLSLLPTLYLKPKCFAVNPAIQTVHVDGWRLPNGTWYTDIRKLAVSGGYWINKTKGFSESLWLKTQLGGRLHD